MLFRLIKQKPIIHLLRKRGLGEKDNYVITFLDQKQAPLTLLKGLVKDAYGAVPKEIVITVTDNETGKVAGVYRPNSKTGQYLFILTPGKNYNISYEADGFMFYSENREISKKQIIMKFISLFNCHPLPWALRLY